MQKCISCRLFGDESSFFPDNKLCKICINKIRKTRTQKVRNQAIEREREQLSIRVLIKQFQENHESYVYLLQADSRYKIGFSKNIDTRVRAFNTANSIPVQIIAVAPGGSRLEKILHKKFEYQRINREWFAFSPKILKEFKQLPGVMVFLKGEMKSEGPTPSCCMDDSELPSPTPVAT